LGPFIPRKLPPSSLIPQEVLLAVCAAKVLFLLQASKAETLVLSVQRAQNTNVGAYLGALQESNKGESNKGESIHFYDDDAKLDAYQPFSKCQQQTATFNCSKVSACATQGQ